MLAMDLAPGDDGANDDGDADGDGKRGAKDEAALLLPCSPAFCGLVTRGTF
jgi:hypothetical protein